MPIVVLGLSTTSSSSSRSTPPTSLPQESTGSTPGPASVESESADEQTRSNPSFNPAKNPKPNKDGDQSMYGATRHFPKYLIGCKNSGKISLMKEFWNQKTHTRVLLMNPL